MLKQVQHDAFSKRHNTQEIHNHEVEQRVIDMFLPFLSTQEQKEKRKILES